MDTLLFFEVVAIFLLIAANGFFSLSEFSIIASRKSRLKQMEKEGKRGAKSASKLQEQPERFLATVQIGITLVGTLAGVFGGATIVEPIQKAIESISISFITDTAGPIAVTLVAFGITISAVILGELIPKYLALSDPERYARWSAGPITMFVRSIAALSTVLSGTANMILRLFGITVDTTTSHVTEDEINMMIQEGIKSGNFDETEERLIRSVFDFADSTVRRAMTPRTDVDAISIDTDPVDIINIIIDKGHSKYPVFKDTIDQIVGILYTRDLFHHKLNPNLVILSDLMRKTTFVPDSMPLSTLLREFQRKKNQFAVVLDEFGGTAGIVTLEDVLEELVGEIQDEDDSKAPPLVKHSDTVAYIDGSVWPGAVNELMSTNLPEDKAETLAGLMIDKIGHLPSREDTVIIADARLSILEIDHNRLTRLKVERLEQPKVDEQENE